MRSCDVIYMSGGYDGHPMSLPRYSSLSEAHRQAFGSAEDTLLSLVLHNLLVYMLMVGLSPEETTDLIHRLTARTRLATAEERLLQQTLKHVEQNVRERERKYGEWEKERGRGEGE